MRVLVVEDDPALARVLEQGLLEDGYAVDVARDGEVGLGLAGLTSYDALVLDLMLPKLDGLRVCQRLRAQGSEVPILILTARDAVEDRVSGLDHGADDYLVKPFSLSELTARLRALLRRRGGSRDPILRARGVELDPSTRTVRYRGTGVDLTRREYQVLETFLRFPSQVLSREEIASHIWDYDSGAESNVVDVYVLSLRRKLEEGLIRTVRGVGYQLVGE